MRPHFVRYVSGLKLGFARLPICAAVAFMPVCAAAQQPSGNVSGPPEAPLIDDNNVLIPADLVSVSVPQLSVGGPNGLSQVLSNWTSVSDLRISCGSSCEGERLSGFYPDFPFKSSLEGGVSFDQSVYTPSGDSATFTYGSVSERFEGVPYLSIGTSISQNGGSMVESPDGLSYTYTDKDGIKYTIDKTLSASHRYYWPVTSITYPDGRQTIIEYRRDVQPGGGYVRRIRSASTNMGWIVRFEYGTNAAYTAANKTQWLWANKVKAGNGTIDYCASGQDICTLTSFKEANISWTPDYRTLNIGDASGATTRFSQTQYYEISAIKPSDSDVDTVSYTYCSRNSTGLCSWYRSGDTDPRSYGLSGSGSGWVVYPGMVYQASAGGETTQYSSTYGAHWSLLVTDYVNSYRGTRTLHQRGNPYSYNENGSYYTLIDPSKGTFGFSADPKNRTTYWKNNSGIQKNYVYDSRGNVTSVIESPPTGSSEASISVSSVFPASCVDMATCNKPISTTDAMGSITEYSYDSVHGGVVSITQPADMYGVRPQKRFVYIQRYAWLKNSSGTFSQSSQPVWLLAAEEYCRTTSAVGSDCTGGSADEVTTTYDYGPSTGPNNLLLRGVAITADGQTLRTCFSYDAFGQRVSETRPRADLANCS